MDWSILFIGPVGAGKTQAIRTASDVEVVSTEAVTTDDVALMKSHTTVAMDMGILKLDSGDRIRLLGTPGQKRFDFMWEILLQQACGVVMLIDHSRSKAQEDMRNYLARLNTHFQVRSVPWVVGITHVDHAHSRDLAAYRDLVDRTLINGSYGPVPVLEVDARSPRDIRDLLMVLAAMMEMESRIPVRAGSRAD